jgi:hypothetical protein
MLMAVLQGRISHWYFVAVEMKLKCEPENNQAFTPLVFFNCNIFYVFDVVTTRLG